MVRWTSEGAVQLEPLECDMEGRMNGSDGGVSVNGAV